MSQAVSTYTPQLTAEQLRKLARIARRRTCYEVVAVRADGERGLVCYSGQHSRRGVWEALSNRGEATLAFLGAEVSARGEDAKLHGQLAVHVFWNGGSALIAFSGRTQRDAIMEGELPFVGQKNSLLREVV